MGRDSPTTTYLLANLLLVLSIGYNKYICQWGNVDDDEEEVGHSGEDNKPRESNR
jgi:hypothetical protein